MFIVVLVIVLIGISALVWVSPTDISLSKDADGAREAITTCAAQNTELRRNLQRATETIASQRGKLTAMQQEALAAQAVMAKRLATVQQEASAAQKKLAAISTQLVAAGAKLTDDANGSISGSSGGSGSTPITVPARADLLSPTSRYYGMYTEQAPFNWATLDSASAKVGVAPGLVGYLGGWDERFRANAVTRAWAQGRMPMMTWESRPISAANDVTNAPEYSLPKIIGGDFDVYLRQYAKDIVATGLPLAIRLDHEMNATWYPWNETDGQGKSINGNNVGDYVKMWRHVHDIFQHEGANSLVVWVWSPNIVNNLASTHKVDGFLEDLYPGDDYVDWMGLSGYMRPPYRPDNDFTFEYTFESSLERLRALASRPILLSEVGASETGGHKPKWIRSFFESLGKSQNDDIIGIAWFNLAVTSYVEGERATNDWRVDSRRDSLSAFIAGVTRPEDRFALTPAP